MLDVMRSFPATPSSKEHLTPQPPAPSPAEEAQPPLGYLQPCACSQRRMAPWPAHQPSPWADSLHELSVMGRGHHPAQKRGSAPPSSLRTTGQRGSDPRV